MNNDHSTRCRVSEDQREQDRARWLDEEQRLTDTPEQIVKDRVEELMDADSTDEDSIVCLMESERFKTVLRKLLNLRHDDKRCHKTLVEDAVNMISVAETVLSEYVEGKL
jgi:hypothetical protein